MRETKTFRMMEKVGSTTELYFSFCIVIYKNADVLEQMFLTLKPFMIEGDEVLVHDNAPTSEDREIIKSVAEIHGLDIKYFTTGTNVGFGAACNLLAEAAINSRTVFLNPDTETSSLVRTGHHPNLIVGPYVFNMAGHRQPSSGTSRTVWDEFKMRWLRKFEHNENGDELSYLSGVAMSIDRQLFLEMGGFDTRYFMYYEDVDLCFRAKRRGVGISIDPKWQINHIGGSSSKKIRAESTKRSYISSLEFHKEWSKHWRLFVFLCFLDAVLRIPYYLLSGDSSSARSFVRLTRIIMSPARTTVAQ